MGRYIVKLAPEKYLHWSTVVDAPISYLMGRDEMKAYIMAEDHQTAEEVEVRLARTDKKGTSALDFGSLEGIEACNRAGYKEANISLKLMLKIYESDDAYKQYEKEQKEKQ